MTRRKGLVLAAGTTWAVVVALWIVSDADPMPRSVWVRVPRQAPTSDRYLICDAPGGAALGEEWRTWRS